jgi:(2R)-3-sulfolactate dehydrogenase (NADP+)
MESVMTVVLTLTEVFDLSKAALVASGASVSNADPVARSVQDAEAEGFRNGGLGYLPHYCEHLRSGRVNGHAAPTLRIRAPAAMQVDADHGFCHAAFTQAEKKFIALVRQTGVACLTITRSYTASALGWFVDRLAHSDLVAMAFTNSSALVAPWGGKRRFFGTNPLAFAAPRPGRAPLVIDMATSATARVNVVEAASRGQPIPAGWALDRDGQPTTDPQRALEGTVAPLGGYKGAVLALMVEILAAGLTGASWSHAVTPLTVREGPPPDLGQLFLALAPERLGAPSFIKRLEEMLMEMLTEEGVRVPGDRRHAARARAEHEGVGVPAALIEKLRGYAH